MRRERLRLHFLGVPGVCGQCGDILDVRRYMLKTGRWEVREGRYWQEVLDSVPLCARCVMKEYDLPPPGKRERWARHGIRSAWID